MELFLMRLLTKFQYATLTAFLMGSPINLTAEETSTYNISTESNISTGKKLNSSRKMLSDLDFIANMFEISYAPSQWKSEYFGWDLNHEIQKAKSSVLQDLLQTSKDFQRIIKNFCLSAKDYHVVSQFYSTECSYLSFHIQSAGDKYFVSQIDSGFQTSDNFPLSVGDEILEFDGEPIHTVVENFRKHEIGSNHLATDKALAEFYLTDRIGSFGHTISQGEIWITYRKAFSDEILSHQFEWTYESEVVVDTNYPCKSKILRSQFFDNLKDPFRKKFMTPHYNLIRNVYADNYDSSDLLGTRKSKIPPLGKILWESQNHEEFHAYLFMMDDWKIGSYIRIPSFYVDGDKAAEEFAELIELFEEMSDVLVIDQLNNGGGYILYLYALLAMLTDKELEVPMHRIMITQEDVYHASKRNMMLESIKTDRSARKKLGDTIEGVIVNLKIAQGLQKSHQFIIDQWNLGNLYTDYCYLYGIEKIVPHPEVNYTKPIIILTNELDFSAADFFPAIMQDNGRAKILGTRTAGAGGFVSKISFPNLSGIECVDLTSSFSRRQNGDPIENLGVIPDVIYEVTQNDLQNNYIDYKQKILEEVGLMLEE